MSNPTNIPVHIGDIIAGKYRVQRVLGVGGMGAVVAAEHLDLGEMRAVKFMFPAALANAPAVERFLREARAASRLKSQHVARVHDIGRLESGLPYIVMELLDGTDLKGALHGGGKLPVEMAIRYLCQMCEAIGEAHAQGIVHRDIKPANVFITKGPRGEDCIKVLDFGIAKIMDDSPAAQITLTQEAFGTPLYMSPEQMRSARVTDERADVWSLGVLLYRMLAGREPFGGETVTAVCASVISDTPLPPSVARADLPFELEAIVMKCLSKDPAGRFANAIQLGNALADLKATLDPAARLSQTSEPRTSRTSENVVSAVTGADGGRPSALPPVKRGPRGTELMLSAPQIPMNDMGAPQTTKTSFMSEAHNRPSAPGLPAKQRPGPGLLIALIMAVTTAGITIAVVMAVRGGPIPAPTTLPMAAVSGAPFVSGAPAAPAEPRSAAPAPPPASAPTGAQIAAIPPRGSSSPATPKGTAAPSVSPKQPPTSAPTASARDPKAAVQDPWASPGTSTAPAKKDKGPVLDPWAPKPPKAQSEDVY